MPDDNSSSGGLSSYIAPAASAFTSVLGGLFSSKANEKINQKNIDFAREMYDKQKADNISFWNMSNAYNSPEQQMQRFIQAGLNKNLVYDKGTNGNASVMSAPPAHAPELRPVNALSGVADAASSFIDTRVKQAQTNNLEVQNANLITDGILKAIGVEQAKTDLSKSQGILPAQLDAAILKNQQTIATIANKQADTSLKGSQQTKVDTESGNLAVKRWILQNQADVAAATKNDTIKSASLKVLNQVLDASKKRSETQLTDAKTRKTYIDSDVRRDEQERIIEATRKIREDVNNNQQNQIRADAKSDREWIDMIMHNLTRYFIF